jgi:hypothetical protein
VNKHLMWLPATALALALAGQAALSYSAGPTTVVHASWKFQPKSIREARDKAESVVQAEVVAVERGEDLVVPAAGEPTGEDRIPTQKITVKVKKAHKGSAKPGETLQLFQTGGAVLPVAPAGGPEKKDVRIKARTVILEGDPLYQPGEEYMLMLEPGPRGLLRPVSPEGRFKVEPGGSVKPMVDNDVTAKLRGKPVAELEREIEGR